jgi:hypothetical protein
MSDIDKYIVPSWWEECGTGSLLLLRKSCLGLCDGYCWPALKGIPIYEMCSKVSLDVDTHVMVVEKWLNDPETFPCAALLLLCEDRKLVIEITDKNINNIEIAKI